MSLNFPKSKRKRGALKHIDVVKGYEALLGDSGTYPEGDDHPNDQ